MRTWREVRNFAWHRLAFFLVTVFLVAVFRVAVIEVAVVLGDSCPRW